MFGISTNRDSGSLDGALGPADPLFENAKILHFACGYEHWSDKIVTGRTWCHRTAVGVVEITPTSLASSADDHHYGFHVRVAGSMYAKADSVSLRFRSDGSLDESFDNICRVRSSWMLFSLSPTEVLQAVRDSMNNRAAAQLSDVPHDDPYT